VAERHRRTMVRLIFLIYWLAIFEGLLRKYAFPEANRLIFFVKDPFVVLLYCFAVKNRLYPLRSHLFSAALGFIAISAPLVLVQWMLSPADFNLMIAIYGWRNYFLYIPLAFFVGKYVTLADIHVLARRTLLVAIAIAPLIYFQFMAPADAPINQGFGRDPDAVFLSMLTVDGGFTRPSGTFTSPVGEACFLGTCTAMLLGTWMLPASRRPLHGWKLWAATAAILSSLALSGSRGTMILCGLIWCTSVIAALISGDRRFALQRLAMPILLLLVGFTVAPLVFPVAVAAFKSRWQSAGDVESEGFGYNAGIVGRLIYQFGAFTSLIPTTPPVGYQLGIAGNAATMLSANDRVQPADQLVASSLETEWGRNIVELGPLLGLAYIAFRLCLIGRIVKSALAVSRRSRDPLPVLLCAFATMTLFQGLITGNGAVVAYAWLFSGFCLVNGKTGKLGRQNLVRHTIEMCAAGGERRKVISAR